MKTVGWRVTHKNGSSCILNAELKNKTQAEDYASTHKGTLEDVVLRSEAEEAIRQARGEFERMQLNLE